MRISLALVGCVLALFVMGLVMVFNTTSAEVLCRALPQSPHHALIKQLLYCACAITGACVVWRVGYQKIIALSGPLLLLGTGLLLLVFIPHIGQELNGARRWINIFGHSFQPSEVVKYLIPLYAISCFIKERMTVKAFIVLLAKIAIPTILILIEPDNGTVFILLATLMVLFFLTRLKWIYWVLPLCVLGAVGACIAAQMPHVHNRIQIFLHPELDLKGKGHQPHQAKIAAGSGKLWGKGLGESLQKMEYLPEARSDYIAAIFAEELGFVGIVVLILVYMTIGFLGFVIASRANNLTGFYLASVVTFLLCFQAFINLGVVSGLLPSKGTNLPFFSHGGSSLIANVLALALLININTEEKYA